MKGTRGYLFMEWWHATLKGVKNQKIILIKHRKSLENKNNPKETPNLITKPKTRRLSFSEEVENLAPEWIPIYMFTLF